MSATVAKRCALLLLAVHVEACAFFGSPIPCRTSETCPDALPFCEAVDGGSICTSTPPPPTDAGSLDDGGDGGAAGGSE